MAYDFTLNPPSTVAIECFDWGRDVYGNPTCHYLISWNNGKTGAEYEGGHYRSKRREQTGYRDKASESAMYTLSQLFPRTAWKIDPDGIDGDRATGFATFTASRDYDREPVPVIFRTVKTGQHKGTVDAFFPTLAGTRDPLTCTVYTRVGQHCTGSRDYYRDTSPATVEESAPLARELESLGYVLEVRKRWTPEFDAIRFNTLNA